MPVENQSTPANTSQRILAALFAFALAGTAAYALSRWRGLLQHDFVYNPNIIIAYHIPFFTWVVTAFIAGPIVGIFTFFLVRPALFLEARKARLWTILLGLVILATAVGQMTMARHWPLH